MAQMDLVGNKNPRNLKIFQPHQISKLVARQENRIPDRLYSKHRRQDSLPLRLDTAKDLRAFFAGKLSGALAFNMPNRHRLAQILYADLGAAGIAHVDESGTRYKDFHGLRTTMATWLAACGVHPKVIQDLMRHSDIGLTMNVYTHTLPGQLSEAVAKLPDLSVSEQGEKRAENA